MRVFKADPKPRNQISLCPDYRNGEPVHVKTYGLKGVVEAAVHHGHYSETKAYWVRLANGKLARVCWYDLEPISD